MEDYLMLPTKEEIKELIEASKHDVAALLVEEPELAPQLQVLKEVTKILEDLIAKHVDLQKIGMKEKISIAAHLNYFECLIEDFFFFDEDEGCEADECCESHEHDSK